MGQSLMISSLTMKSFKELCHRCHFERTEVTHRITHRAIITWRSLGTRRSSSTRWTSFSFLSSFSFGTLHNKEKHLILLQVLKQLLNLSILGQALLCCGSLSHCIARCLHHPKVAYYIDAKHLSLLQE